MFKFHQLTEVCNDFLNGKKWPEWANPSHVRTNSWYAGGLFSENQDMFHGACPNLNFSHQALPPREPRRQQPRGPSRNGRALKWWAHFTPGGQVPQSGAIHQRWCDSPAMMELFDGFGIWKKNKWDWASPFHFLVHSLQQPSCNYETLLTSSVLDVKFFPAKFLPSNLWRYHGQIPIATVPEGGCVCQHSWPISHVTVAHTPGGSGAPRQKVVTCWTSQNLHRLEMQGDTGRIIGNSGWVGIFCAKDVVHFVRVMPPPPLVFVLPVPAWALMSVICCRWRFLRRSSYLQGWLQRSATEGSPNSESDCWRCLCHNSAGRYRYICSKQGLNSDIYIANRG